jgi:hypothetical protein
MASLTGAKNLKNAAIAVNSGNCLSNQFESG